MTDKRIEKLIDELLDDQKHSIEIDSDIGMPTRYTVTLFHTDKPFIGSRAELYHCHVGSLVEGLKACLAHKNDGGVVDHA